jgi:hypothetical protein
MVRQKQMPVPDPTTVNEVLDLRACGNARDPIPANPNVNGWIADLEANCQTSPRIELGTITLNTQASNKLALYVEVTKEIRSYRRILVTEGVRRQRLELAI